MTSIGVIGIGRMGMPICGRLAGGRLRVLAADRRGELADEVRLLGAEWLGDAAAVAGACEVLITVLPGTNELVDVMSLAMPALRAGSTWIDMTSADPERALELMEIARARGISCLDSPLGGGVERAGAGTLQLFVGGGVDTLELHRDLLSSLGRIEHVGEQGAGYTVKLLVNLLWFGQALAVAEAMLLAKRAGLDLERLREALGRSAAASRFIADDLGKLLDGDYLESFGFDRCCEELEAVVSTARTHGVPFELSNCVLQAYRQALERFGPVDGELLAVALLEERTGLRLRRT